MGKRVTGKIKIKHSAPDLRMKIYIRQLKSGLHLLTDTRGGDRFSILLYLIRNFLNKALKISFERRLLTINIGGMKVSAQTFSEQFGAYMDIFKCKVYEKIPGFAAKPGYVVVDAGANVGFYSLRQAPLTGASGHVYAFEPNPGAYEILKKNILQNGLDWVECFPFALTSVDGDCTLHADEGATSTGRILPGKCDEEGEGIRVKGRTLDAFVAEHDLDRIDILKMDTEGSEAEILKGGLAKALPITRKVVMESHNTRYLVRDILAPLGFKMALDDRSTHTVYFER